MASFTITESKKGVLQAKIQVNGKDAETGKRKTFVKRIYNTDGLTEAKFRKLAEKLSIAFEEEIAAAYQQATTDVRSRILTFSELMIEWKAHIQANLSINYLGRAEQVEKLFTAYLEEHHLAHLPISEISVRDVELFLKSFKTKKMRGKPMAKLKQELPKTVNFRELAREKILPRCTSYNLKKRGTSIEKETADRVCEKYGLDFTEFFEVVQAEEPYAVETIRGYRRILRALFNEAVRYEWIQKNPVCKTKVGAGSGNTTLRPVSEKEVFSIREAQRFMALLNELPDEFINRKMPLKFMLLTGVRIGEMCGLRWSDIDLERKIVHIQRNRLYSSKVGIYEKDPKTGSSIRDIPLPDVLVEDLRQYMEWFREADALFDERMDMYYLAVNIYREPLSPQRPGVWLKNYVTEWGLKHVTCHGLRHTYCSILLSLGVPIQTVSRYMGHSDPTITLKVYSHFIPDTQETALLALSSITN